MRVCANANFIALSFLAGTLFLSASSASNETLPAIKPTFKLSDTCPAALLLVAGHCQLHTPYQQYQSLQSAGVGGLKTSLPKVRDGFTAQQIDLGRYLFFDPLLSGNNKVACASCHDPAQGFSDGLARSIGVTGTVVKRGAPSLWNVAFLQKLFWDGRARSLEEQMQGPLYSADEMGNSRENLLASLNAVPVYREMFASAFPESNGIQLPYVYTALAAFESSLISLNSRYDWYAHGISEALNKNEIEGLNIFRSFVARCAECHTPPLFTNQQIAVIGTPETKGTTLDSGAQGVSGDKSQRAGFKVPSLRNVALTAPYEHSGVFDSLHDAVKFYTLGRGHAVPKGEQLLLHWHIWEPKLTDAEIDRLVDFLQTLTDESFMPTQPDRLPSGLSLPQHQKLQLTQKTILNAGKTTPTVSATGAPK